MNTVRVIAGRPYRVRVSPSTHPMDIVPTATVARQRRPSYTHFLSLPMDHGDERWMERLRAFQDAVLQLQLPDIQRHLFSKPGALHLTLGMLSLTSTDDIQKASRCLEQLSGQIYNQLETRSLLVRLRGLDVIVGSPDRCHVLYAKIELLDDRLMRVLDTLHTRFRQEGLLDEDQTTRSLKLHCTLMRTKGDYGDAKNQPFDARPILKAFGDFDFGLCRLPQVQLCIRRTAGQGIQGAYKYAVSISLP